MKKNLVSIILGFALLGASQLALAGQNRTSEPQWGIRPERSAPLSPLDLARWLARRLVGTIGEPVPVPYVPLPSPNSAPVKTQAPGDGDVICNPERGHCPVG